MSAIPDTGTWREGNLNAAARCFDVLVSGKCDISTNSVKLNIQSVDKIPDFFTKNSEGEIVFAEPTVACVIEAAKGHPSWIQIELKNVNGDMTSDIATHACLGIKKQNEDEFFDIIHAGKLTSDYVDVTEGNAVELVPLLSKSTTTTNGYTEVTPGEEIQFDDIVVPTTGAFNFGSVYRINVNDNGPWLENQPSNINNVVNKDNGYWWNCGKIGVGTIIDKNGQLLENQLLAVNCFGWLAYSDDGTHWIDAGSIGANCSGWNVGATYGNGIWCITNFSNDNQVGGTVRSINGGQNWQKCSTLEGSIYSFENSIFMIISEDCTIYTSRNAENWTQVGKIEGQNPSAFRILMYGHDKWICGTGDGYIFYSTDEGKTWKQFSGGLYEINDSEDSMSWNGGCYANGHFYVISGNIVARSSDGEHWEKVTEFSNNVSNITYFKGKLWMFTSDGTKYNVGLI